MTTEDQRRRTEAEQPTPSNKEINAPGGQFGVVGDNARIEGGIHFHTNSDQSRQTVQGDQYNAGRNVNTTGLTQNHGLNARSGFATHVGLLKTAVTNRLRALLRKSCIIHFDRFPVMLDRLPVVNTPLVSETAEATAATTQPKSYNSLPPDV